MVKPFVAVFANKLLPELPLALFYNEINGILVETERWVDSQGFGHQHVVVFKDIRKHHTFSIEIMCCQPHELLMVIAAHTDLHLTTISVR